MFRWLPDRLQTLYRRIAEAAPYVRARPPPAMPDPPPTPGAWQRLHRLHIAQDAFCERRPGPRRLFKAEPALRNADSWCDPWTWRGLWRNAPPRCEHCAQARRLFDAARGGDWRAECRLHRLARRGAVRLLAERREWRDRRRGIAAARRAARADRAAGGGPGVPDPLHLGAGSTPPRRADVWHRAARWEEERSLLRAHARLLLTLARRRRARMTEAARRPAPPRRAPVAPPAPPRPETAAPAAPAEAVAPAEPVALAEPAAPATPAPRRRWRVARTAAPARRPAPAPAPKARPARDPPAQAG